MYQVIATYKNKMPNKSFAALMGDRSQTNTRTKPFSDRVIAEGVTLQEAEHIALEAVEVGGAFGATFEAVR